MNKAEANDSCKIEVVVLDPGHFHASLLQKDALAVINDTIRIYAPEGIGVNQYLESIDSYNHRPKSPTTWKKQVYTPFPGRIVHPLLVSQQNVGVSALRAANALLCTGRNPRRIWSIPDLYPAVRSRWDPSGCAGMAAKARRGARSAWTQRAGVCTAAEKSQGAMQRASLTAAAYGVGADNGRLAVRPASSLQ